MPKNSQKKGQEEEGGGGAPEWMVTFSDCMTLLLTFFVLLLSFSSFDDKIFFKLRPYFLKQMPKINKDKPKTKSSLKEPLDSPREDQPENGSESPTDPRNEKSGSMEEDFSDDFSIHKVFTADSAKFFWGNGKVLSSEGKDTLSNIAKFLSMRQEKVVISENSIETGEQRELERSWEIAEFLVNKGIERGRMSITSNTTLQPRKREMQSERMVEIALLEQKVSK